MTAHPTLPEALRTIFKHPAQVLLRRWNWKAAILSTALRGSVFFAVNLAASRDAAIAALATELWYRGFLAGFNAAAVQAIEDVRPARHATTFVALALPTANHLVEFAVHWVRGTQKLGASILVSVCVTAVALSFTLFTMRRGVLRVGSQGQSLLSDIRQLPALLLKFLTFSRQATSPDRASTPGSQE